MAKLARLSIPDEQVADVAADMDRVVLDFGSRPSSRPTTPNTGRTTAGRRDDAATRERQAEGQDVVTAHVGETGAVVVPPIKGAS